MGYRVEIAKSAQAQLEELYLWVVERAPSQGGAWFNRLEQAILSLDQNPKRCPVAPESFDSSHPIRVLHYGRSPHVYRVFSPSTIAPTSFVSSTFGVARDEGRY